MTATLRGLPEGREGVAATLNYMKQFVIAGKKTLPVRNTALALTRHLRQKDWIGQIRSLHAFVRDRIRYVRDINGTETIQSPEVTLTVGAGDCDDKSVLLAALLESIGHATRFRAAFSPVNGEGHVYVETFLGHNRPWLALETTEPVGIGWAPKGLVDPMVVYNS